MYSNIHLIRQIDLLRLSDSRVLEIALEFGLDLKKCRDPNREERLLEILERYESILDRAQEFLADPEILESIELDNDAIASLAVFCDIQEKESQEFDSILFNFPLNITFAQTMQIFNANAVKLKQLGLLDV